MSDRNPYYQRPEHISDNGSLSRLKRTTFGTLIFTASYIAAVYIDRLAIYFSSRSFGYDASIFFWRISGLPTKYIEWSKERVLLIFSSGTMSLVVIAALILLVYKLIPKSWASLKFFLLWLVFNSLALSGANIGTSLFGFENYSSVYYNNFSVIFLWWGFPVFLLWFLLIAYAILLFITGYAGVNLWLRFSHSQRLVRKYYGRLQVLSQLYVFPFVLGSLALLPFSFDNILFLGFHFLCLLLLLTGMVARLNVYYELHSVYRMDLVSNKPWLFLFFSLLLILPVLNR